MEFDKNDDTRTVWASPMIQNFADFPMQVQILPHTGEFTWVILIFPSEFASKIVRVIVLC